MMNQDQIHHAFDTLAPDDAARERMLRQITLRAHQAPAGKDVPLKTNTVKKTIVLVAAAVLLLAFATVGYATDLFGLRSAILGRYTYETEDGSNVATDVISLQGLSDSPEYLANAQWREFCQSYDMDEAILAQIGNGDTGLDETHDDYGCYTQDMADKLDEIAAQNGLQLLTGLTLSDGGMPADVAAVAPAGTGYNNQILSGYTYANGSFKYDGQYTFTGSDAVWPYTMAYELSCQHKGYMSVTTLSIGNIDDYAQWQYETACGVTVTLAYSDMENKALVILDTDTYYLVLNLLDIRMCDTVYGEMSMPQTELQRLADTFDFSVLR